MLNYPTIAWRIGFPDSGCACADRAAEISGVGCVALVRDDRKPLAMSGYGDGAVAELAKALFLKERLSQGPAIRYSVASM